MPTESATNGRHPAGALRPRAARPAPTRPDREVVVLVDGTGENAVRLMLASIWLVIDSQPVADHFERGIGSIATATSCAPAPA